MADLVYNSWYQSSPVLGGHSPAGFRAPASHAITSDKARLAFFEERMMKIIDEFAEKMIESQERLLAKFQQRLSEKFQIPSKTTGKEQTRSSEKEEFSIDVCGGLVLEEEGVQVVELEPREMEVVVERERRSGEQKTKKEEVPDIKKLTGRRLGGRGNFTGGFVGGGGSGNVAGEFAGSGGAGGFAGEMVVIQPLQTYGTKIAQRIGSGSGGGPSVAVGGSTDGGSKHLLVVANLPWEPGGVTNLVKEKQGVESLVNHGGRDCNFFRRWSVVVGHLGGVQGVSFSSGRVFEKDPEFPLKKKKLLLEAIKGTLESRGKKDKLKGLSGDISKEDKFLLCPIIHAMYSAKKCVGINKARIYGDLTDFCDPFFKVIGPYFFSFVLLQPKFSNSAVHPPLNPLTCKPSFILKHCCKPSFFFSLLFKRIGHTGTKCIPHPLYSHHHSYISYFTCPFRPICHLIHCSYICTTIKYSLAIKLNSFHSLTPDHPSSTLDNSCPNITQPTHTYFSHLLLTLGSTVTHPYNVFFLTHLEDKVEVWTAGSGNYGGVDRVVNGVAGVRDPTGTPSDCEGGWKGIGYDCGGYGGCRLEFGGFARIIFDPGAHRSFLFLTTVMENLWAAASSSFLFLTTVMENLWAAGNEILWWDDSRSNLLNLEMEGAFIHEHFRLKFDHGSIGFSRKKLQHKEIHGKVSSSIEIQVKLQPREGEDSNKYLESSPSVKRRPTICSYSLADNLIFMVFIPSFIKIVRDYYPP